MIDEHNNKSIYEPNSVIRVLWEYNLVKIHNTDETFIAIDVHGMRECDW